MWFWRLFPLAFLFVQFAQKTGAWAHPQFSISTVNRYARLVLLPDHVLIQYTLMVGETPTKQLLEQADWNQDRVLSSDEEKSLSQRLLRAVEKGISVMEQNQKGALRFQSPVLSISKEPPITIAFEITAQVSLSPETAVYDLRWEDRTDLPPWGEIETRLEPAPDVSLLLAECPSGVIPAENGTPNTTPNVPRLFRQYGPPRSMLSDRTTHFRFRKQLSTKKERTFFGCVNERFQK